MATTQTNSDFLTSNPNDNVDVGSLVQKLLSSVNTSSQNGAGGVNGTSSNLPPSQQIMQDVATKTYTKQLQAHADSVPHPVLGALLDSWAANGGTQTPMQSPSGNPTSISAESAQSVGAGPGTVQPQAQPQIQVPTGQPSQAPAQQVQQPKDINAQIDAINKQTALNIAKKNLQASQPQSFMQRFNQQFTKMSGGQTQAEDLANNKTIQSIAGAEPIQPKDVGELNARTYSAALDAAHNGVTAEASKLTALADLYGKEQPNRNMIDVAMGRENANQTLIRKNIQNSADNITNHLSNLRTLIANRPTFSTQGINTQTQDVVNKIKEGQTATNPKTKQKIVYKGGKWLTAQQ